VIRFTIPSRTSAGRPLGFLPALVREGLVKRITALAVLGLGISALAGCANGTQAEKRLNGGGTSFVYPMMSKWASDYEKAHAVQVNYQSIGSGGGIQQMTSKTIDFGCTDAPMNQEQLDKAKEVGGEVVHIPLVMGAAVPIYNLPNLAEPVRFSGPVLADIYLNKIKKWNDPALKALNPKIDLPDQEIAVVHRSDGSGTTYMWSDYLCKVSPEWEKQVGRGTSLNWPCGIGQKGSEGVTGQVRRSAGSIGYVEMIYALQNDVKYGPVKNKDGEFVQGSLESVTAAASSALTTIPDDLRFSITDAPGKEAYPISSAVWAVVYVDQPPDRGRLLVDFLRWVTHEGQESAAALKYARLPKGLVERLEKKIDRNKVGA
jgi:phosphate transport system substrate-binding protein